MRSSVTMREEFVIVIVEDEPLIRYTAAAAFEDADFAVIEASNAGEALAILEREADHVQVVFTDVHMPGPMDGLTLARHVHRHRPCIGLLVASGRAIGGKQEIPKGSRFVQKPYSLKDVVHQALELASAS